MFATAKGANSGSWPAFQAKVMSTAYSGSTAMKAMKAMKATASPCEMSTSAASAAQLSRKAAATIARPKRIVSATVPSCSPLSRSTIAGRAIAIMMPMSVTALRMPPPGPFDGS